MREHLHYGRLYRVEAFRTDDAANAFMLANPGWGVLAVVGSEVLVAAKADKGRRPAEELTPAGLQLVLPGCERVREGPKAPRQASLFE